MDLRQSNYIPQFQSNENKACKIQQAAIVSCMAKMNKTGSQSRVDDIKKKEVDEDCYLPAISAWNECVVRNVGYL